MTSFGWRRKVGSHVSRAISQKFEENSKDPIDDAIANDEVDWLSLAPKRRCPQLEDSITKSARLRQEGVVLAEAERFWEAIGKWDEALHLTPHDETLYEMKSQALMSVGEVFPAVNAAEKAVAINGKWWIGHQTLGRALLGLGEVKLALSSFCRAFHLNPVDEALFRDDIMWALELVNRKAALDEEQEAALASDHCVTIVELDAEEGSLDVAAAVPCQDLSCMNSADSSAQNQYQELPRIPPNYVVMRD